MTVLTTPRLTLRPPEEADLVPLLPLIGDFEVAKYTSRAPHPYTEKDARAFFAKMTAGWANGEDLVFSILARDGGDFVGCCGLHPKQGWEFGYWLGRPYWGRGYATEAATRLIAYGFEARSAQKLTAKWFHDNPASGRVLAKLGLKHEGEEMSNCLARGHKVPAHVWALDRATYAARKMRP